MIGLIVSLAVVLAEPPPNALRVEVARWYDADTPKGCKVYLPLGVILDEPDGLRAINYDSWEVGNRPGAAVSQDERTKGKAALDQLVQEHEEHDLRFVPSKLGRDKYGRPLGEFWLKRTVDGEWIELGQWARANGHVRTPQ